MIWSWFVVILVRGKEGLCTGFLFLFRSSHRRCSIRKGVLRNFAKFTGKHLCQSLFFNKIAARLSPRFINTEAATEGGL